MNGFDALRAEWQHSLIWGVARATAASYTQAWPHSTTGRMWARAAAGAPRHADAQLRLLGIALAIAITSHAVISRTMLTGYVRSSLPWYWPALGALGALAVAAAAPALVRAWPHSLTAAAFRWLASAWRPEAR